MSDDVVSLRLLVVTDARPQVDMWQQGAAMASVPIEFSAEDAAAAVDTLAKEGVDICVIDSDLPHADKDSVIRAARAAANPAPLVVTSAPRGSPYFDDVDGLLTKPSNSEEARKEVEKCARAKIPAGVLIVDDSTTMRGIVRKILSASRFALVVHEASDGAVALDQLSGGKFAIVFLDQNMPGLDSFQTLAEIRQLNANVAVVMMGATVDRAAADRARSTGALAFLKKPFYPADVDAVLARHYGLRITHV
jgi:DNA-binding response OmpR family regulator